MNPYRITPKALEDLQGINAYLHERWNDQIAETTEAELFSCFQLIADRPGIGHRRPDLTSREVTFFTSDPCLIVYVRNAVPTAILRVLHGSRNV